ncbi:MAG: ABC transporter substrate-binding protein [Clostridia bacterium]|nr:ABC transporter substrate-binding protein [Clostridia bacterium]
MKRIISVFVIISLMICLMPSCGKKKEYPVTINGVEITSAPTKIVSLSPSFTDIIFLLGYESLLVGISDRCDYEEAKTLTRCGTSSSPEVDIIIALGTNLVLADRELPPDAVKRLNASDVLVLSLNNATNHSELKELYTNIGSALGGKVTGSAHGRNVATILLDTLDDIGRTAFGATEYKTVLYMDDLDGKKIATGDTFLGYVFNCCNINNAADSCTDWQFDKEFIAIADPDVIFCKKGIGYDLRRSTQFANIKAIKSRDVYEIDEMWLEKQGSTLISLAKFIVESTYPEVDTPYIPPIEDTIEKDEQELIEEQQN